jgi:redox-sensitive bicupin YhaK (pirin superfamily)
VGGDAATRGLGEDEIEMIHIRKAHERGHADHGWLDTYHTFSFGAYYDPAHMQFRALRVMNEDRVQPGRGFGTHAHHDMEIVTYVLDGALEHKDSMGNGEVLRPGEFQRMSAGTGIEHSEFNPSDRELAHFYQIWVLPETKGIDPSYQQTRFPEEGRNNRWQLVAARDGHNNALLIHQDVLIFLSELDQSAALAYDLPPGRHAWLQVLRGAVVLNGVALATSDGAAISDESRLSVAATQSAEVMLFDLN